MMKKPDNIVRIPCSLNKSFFRLWFKFLEPFHKLTDREIDVITSLSSKDMNSVKLSRIMRYLIRLQ